jgi:FAD/FMN-containing dehydrogenase
MTDSSWYDDLGRRAFLAGVVGATVTACTPGSASTTDPTTGPTTGQPLPVPASTSGSPTGTATPPSSTSTTATPAAIAALRGAIGGAVVLPGDSGYAAAARLFNPRFDGAHPVAVAYCTTDDDVRRCVDAARADGVQPIPRAGGHSYAGYSTGAGLVIDVTGIRTVERDPSIAYVGGGARLFDVYKTLGPMNVGIPAGSCPTVGVAGFTLGGGLGIEAREFGLTADRLLAVDVVLASGDLVTATARDHADLFWACRGGGGGNFGIATRFTFQTHPTADFTRWQLRWPWAAAADVLQGWSGWVAGSPRQLVTAVNCSSTASSAKSSAKPSVTIFGVLRGSPAHAQSLMAELAKAIGVTPIATFRRTASHDATVRQLAGCSELTDSQCDAYSGSGAGIPRQAYAAGSDLLRARLTPAAAQAVVQAIDDRQARHLQTGTFLIDSLGGAIDDVAPDATAYPHRGAIASLQYLANWEATDRAAVVASNLAWFAATKAALAPHLSGDAYVNYIDPDRKDWRTAYYGANYDKLLSVKSTYDPDRLFSFPQAIGA